MLFNYSIVKNINSEPKKKSLRVFEGLHKNILEQAESDSETESEDANSQLDQDHEIHDEISIQDFL